MMDTQLVLLLESNPDRLTITSTYSTTTSSEHVWLSITIGEEGMGGLLCFSWDTRTMDFKWEKCVTSHMSPSDDFWWVLRTLLWWEQVLTHIRPMPWWLVCCIPWDGSQDISPVTYPYHHYARGVIISITGYTILHMPFTQIPYIWPLIVKFHTQKKKYCNMIWNCTHIVFDTMG